MASETMAGEIKRLQDELRAYKSAQARLVKDMPTFSATVNPPANNARKKIFIWARGVTPASFIASWSFTGSTSPNSYIIPAYRDGRVGWFMDYASGQNWPLTIISNQEATYDIQQLN